MTNMATVIEAIGAANPPIAKSQQEAAAFLKRIDGIPEAIRGKIDRIFCGSAIDRRHTCIQDYDLAPSQFMFYPPNASLTPAPSTAARNRVYRQWAPRIAEIAAREAIGEAARAPGEITHLITVSCTGFYSPGLDADLIHALDMRPDTQRTMIGFMGCCAAFNALRAADAICKSDPRAVVMLVCVELCTLHFQPVRSLEDLVVSALFADGAAAAVLSSRPRRSGPALCVERSITVLDSRSRGDMTWTVGDTGFLMGLSARIPSRLAEILPAFAQSLTAGSEQSPPNVDAWAIHPGGRKVLDKAVETLNLAPQAVDESYAVLREYGNMSSATILFILARLIKRLSQRPLRRVAALGFGPGLTIEGCLFSAC